MFFGTRDTLRDHERRIQELESLRNTFRVEQEELLGRIAKAYERIRMQVARQERLVPPETVTAEPNGRPVPVQMNPVLARKGYDGLVRGYR